MAQSKTMLKGLTSLIILFLASNMSYSREIEQVEVRNKSDLKKIILDSNRTYHLLRDDSSRYFILEEGTQMKEIDKNIATPIWEANGAQITLRERIDSLKTKDWKSWLLRRSAWPKKTELYYLIDAQKSYNLDINNEFGLNVLSSKNYIHWNISLWKESHFRQVLNKSMDLNNFSDLGYKIGAGVPGFRVSLISNQSGTQQFSFLESNMFNDTSETTFLNDNIFADFDTIPARNGNMMGQVEFKIWHLEYSLWIDKDLYKTSIQRFRFNEIPFYNSTIGAGFITGNDMWVPGIWNEVELITLYDGFVRGKRLKTSINFAWEFWYQSDTNIELKAEFKIPFNDFIGDLI